MIRMEQWSKDQFMDKLEKGEPGAFYLYTPLCGTCQLAEKMVEVLRELFPEVSMGKADVNFMPDLAERFLIESVPCLVLFKGGKVLEKIYAFHSVPYLFEKVKTL